MVTQAFTITPPYGQSIVSYRIVTKWANRFSSGRESVEDDLRSTAVITRQSIDAAADLLNIDPHITVDYIAYMLDTSYRSVDPMLPCLPKLNKPSSGWIPHQLTLAQRQRLVEYSQKIESCTYIETRKHNY